VTGVRVKICGLTRAEDARAAEAAGATYGGVILARGGPRSLEPAAAAAVLEGTGLRRVGVFVNEDPDAMLRSADLIGLQIMQLHGEESPERVDELRRSSGREVWKAIRPRGGEEFALALEAYAEVVDGLLLDGWSPSARGGTGARFPWAEIAAFRDRVPEGVRLIAAGGLTPENVAEAVAVLRPAVVDVSSGVEVAPGIKQHSLIERFAAAAFGAAGDNGAG
jgi:phosphoribosylanthranilate isomerase